MPRPQLNFSALYQKFEAPICDLDCGQICAVYNADRGPVCCDICQAIPVTYQTEWTYLAQHTNLWHLWQPDECQSRLQDQKVEDADINSDQVLLACQGAAHCQREYRAISCRQFPFFPYISADSRFLGLTYYWQFENNCWVISHLDQVSIQYRQQFVAFFDQLFNYWPEEMESYANLSEIMREYFLSKKRRIPILHRNGNDYLLSPGNERISQANPSNFRKFSFSK